MEEKIINVLDDEFDTEVLKSDKPVLVDFWASWCMPCKMLAPIVEELANEANGAYKVGKVNVDEAPELAARYRIAGIPAIVVFKDGEVYKKSIGVVPKADLEELLK